MTSLAVQEDNSSKTRGSRFRWLGYSLVIVSVVAGAGLLIKGASDTHGYNVVSESVEDFAGLMRIIRPLLFFICFCYWANVVGFFRRIRVLQEKQAANLVTNRNRFFMWVALLEISIGQGFVVIGLSILIAILVYNPVVAWIRTRTHNDS